MTFFNKFIRLWFVNVVSDGADDTIIAKSVVQYCLNKFSTYPHELMPCVPLGLPLLPTSYLDKFHTEMACFPHEMMKCVVAFVVWQQNIFRRGHIWIFFAFHEHVLHG